MATAKEIKGRIQSIKNTQKTTKAMELVSGAKMRKATVAMMNTRPYRSATKEIMGRLSYKMSSDASNPMLRFFVPQDAPKRVAIVAFTSNRGLCGAFNSNIIKLVRAEVDKYGKENADLFCIGKRGVGSLNAFGYTVKEAYEKDDSAKDDGSVRSLASILYNSFLHQEVDKIVVAYTHYGSAVLQTPTLYSLFPFEYVEEEQEKVQYETPYTFERTSTEVAEAVVPRAAEVLLYQSLLESNASEHSARMIAMKNATDAAGEMKEELLLVYNRARQASITKEIAEIAAGSAAIGA